VLASSLASPTPEEFHRQRRHFRFGTGAKLLLASSFVITLVAISGIYLLGSRQGQGGISSQGTPASVAGQGAISSGSGTDSLHLNRATFIDYGSPLTASGPVTFKDQVDSTSALAVQTASSADVLVVDTANSKIGIDTVPAATGASLQLAGNIDISGQYLVNGRPLSSSGVAGAANATLAGNSFNGPSQLVQLATNGLLPILSGANLTNLNASNLNSGTVADARLNANVALLNAAQTFSGNNVFKPVSDSTTAFQIQNTAGTSNLLVADSISTRIGIGTLTPAYTLDVAGDINSSTGVRVNGNLLCNAGGCVAAGGSGNYVQNGTALQTANFDIESASTTSVTGTIRAATGQTAALLQLKDQAGVNILTVGSTGDTLIQPSTNSINAFLVYNADATSHLIGGDTLNARVAIAKPTPPDYTLDVGGDINTTTGLRVNGNLVCSATCTPGGGSGNYIQNGTALQTANFAIQSDLNSHVVSLIRGASGQSADLLDLVAGDVGTNVVSFGASGQTLFKNSTDSTTAFQVQNAAGTSTLLNVDTTDSRVQVGAGVPVGSYSIALDVIGGTVTGPGNFGYNASVTDPLLQVSLPGDTYLPDSSGITTVVRININNRYNQSTGASINLGKSSADSRIVNYTNVGNDLTTRLQLQTHAQASNTYNPGIVLYGNGNVTVGADNCYGSCNFTQGILIPNGTVAPYTNYTGNIGASSYRFGGVFAGTGNFQNQTDSTTAFQVQNALGKTVLTADTSGGQVVLGNSGASGVTGNLKFNYSAQTGSISLTAANPTATAYTVTLPAETGVLCSTASVCSGYAPASGSSNYVQLQSSIPGTQQTGNFNISGTGIAGTLLAGYTSVTGGVAAFNGNVGIGTSSPASLGDGGSPIILQVQNTANVANAYGLLSLASTRTTAGELVGQISFGTTGSAGEKRTAGIQAVLDSSGTAGGQLQFFTNNAGTVSQKMIIQGNGNVGINNTNPALKLQVTGVQGGPATSGTAQTGTARFLTVNSALDFGSLSNGNSWLQVTDATNLALNYNLLLNPNGGNIILGTASATPAILVLGIKNDNATDPTCTAGSIYYNSSSSAFRGCQDIPSGWTNLGNPSGTIVAFAGSSAPAGYLMADGSAVSRTTYATLFAVISTTYGTGNGSTTFNLPDLRGRVAVGLNTSEVTRTDVNALGNNEGVAVGSRTPYHESTVVQPTISQPGVTISASASGGSIPYGGSGGSNTGITDTTPAPGYRSQAFNVEPTITATGSLTGPPVASGGTVGPQSNVPTDTPAYLTVNYIIKY
jgi:microcystin-dependent protein